MQEPRDDVTTRLVEAEVDGERLDDREFGVFFILLTTAGNETTRHTISLGLQALLEHPEEAARLQADPSLAATAADEILRWGTSRAPLPAHGDARRRRPTGRRSARATRW